MGMYLDSVRRHWRCCGVTSLFSLSVFWLVSDLGWTDNMSVKCVSMPRYGSLVAQQTAAIFSPFSQLAGT